MPVDVVSISTDGTATLADGREVQLVMAYSGALGCRPIERAAADLSVDQVGNPPLNLRPGEVPPGFSIDQ